VDGVLWEPNSLIKLSVISARSILTCKLRQVTKSPGEEGVGNSLISVAVGCGETTTVGGLADLPAEAQAVKMKSPMSRMLTIFFIKSPANQPTFNTQDAPSCFHTVYFLGINHVSTPATSNKAGTSP
jgi:hypothetical protein